MKRLSADEFLAKALETVPDLPPRLLEQLISIAQRAPSSRQPLLIKALQEADRG